MLFSEIDATDINSIVCFVQNSIKVFTFSEYFFFVNLCYRKKKLIKRIALLFFKITYGRQ